MFALYATHLRAVAVVLLFTTTALVATPSLLAQSTQATLNGTVIDESGAVVPGAKIAVINHGTAERREASTDGNGYFVVPLLQPGPYTLRAQREGFAVSQIDLVLNVNDQKQIQIKLKVGKTSETVDVSSESAQIETSAAVGTVVDHQFVENIPMNGRSLESLISLVPGVVTVVGANTGFKGEFSVNGQRTEENYYTVDGVSANSGTRMSTTALGASALFGASGSVPGVSALGTTQSLVSIDALQEFRIQTSTYAAEYGRVPGGQISFVTRSGTNDWHGSAFDYLRNNSLDANNWFNNHNHLPKTAERQNDFGGTFGGPIVIPHLYDGHNRTFFFFSYEGLRLVSPQAAQTSLVPDLALRASAKAALQPLLSMYPLPNGPENGTTGTAQFVSTFSLPSSLDSTSVRIDHRINNKFTLFGRYSDAPSQSLTRSSAVSNPLLTFSDVKTLTVGSTGVLTSRLVNEFRYNYTWNSGASTQTVDSFGGATPLTLAGIKDFTGQPTPIVDGFALTLAFGGASTYFLQNLQQHQGQYNVVDSISYSLGRHSLKFGVDFRQVTTPLTLPHAYEGGTFSTVAQVQSGVALSVQQMSFPGTPIAPIYKNLSLFAQDEWKTTQRLTLSIGLRWDVNPSPTDANGNLPYTLDQITNLSTSKVAPKGTPLWNTTYRNFGPRVGAAYQLRRASGWEMVLRGGFGLFYDTGNTYASQGYSALGIAINQTVSNLPFPLTTAQFTSLPAPNVTPPYATAVFGFDPNLQLPYTWEWNTAIQQGLGKAQTLTVSSVGSAARKLLYQYLMEPGHAGTPGNTNFTATNSQVTILENKPTADYDALQVQFQRRLSHGLQAMASYTWSHSIDESSINSAPLSNTLLRADSAFDVRHTFQAAITYEVPGNYTNPVASAILRHWALDSRITGHSALPLDILSGRLIDPLTGVLTTPHADQVPGQPVYLSDPTAPGGRVINFSAFMAPTAAELAARQFGSAPRDGLRGFDLWQTDMAVRRDFPLNERVKLQFRAEAFNVFNHPIFGTIDTSLTDGAALFGRASGIQGQLGGLNPLYNQGGPRSIQLSLKLAF